MTPTIQEFLTGLIPLVLVLLLILPLIYYGLVKSSPKLKTFWEWLSSHVAFMALVLFLLYLSGNNIIGRLFY